jgi:hypothetical protein
MRTASALLIACATALVQAPIDLPVFKTSHFGNSQTDVVRNALPSLALGSGITNLELHSITQPGVCVGTFIDNGRAATELSGTAPHAAVIEMYCSVAQETGWAVQYATMAYQANPPARSTSTRFGPTALTTGRCLR